MAVFSFISFSLIFFHKAERNSKMASSERKISLISLERAFIAFQQLPGFLKREFAHIKFFFNRRLYLFQECYYHINRLFCFYLFPNNHHSILIYTFNCKHFAPPVYWSYCTSIS